MFTADDRFAIQDVVARYNNSCDDFNLADAISTLTEDVKLSLHVNNAAVPMVELNGTGELRKFLEPRHEQHQAEGVEVRHLMHNYLFVDVAQVTASLRCQVVVLYQRNSDLGDPEPRPVQAGTYRYNLRRTEQGWLIAGIEARTSGVYSAQDVFNFQA